METSLVVTTDRYCQILYMAIEKCHPYPMTLSDLERHLLIHLRHPMFSVQIVKFTF